MAIRYYYEVSFRHNAPPQGGFGYAEVSMRVPITRHADVRALATFLEQTQGVPDVCPLYFTLLRTEEVEG